MLKTSFMDVRINPLGIVSGFFLLLAPFAGWMTLSAFGFVTGSNLWEIANSQTNFPISQRLASAAFYSAILLILGGLVSLKWTKFGLPFAAVALSVFGVESYPTFGTFPSAIPVSVLPGLGLFLVLAGIVLGLGSLRWGETPLANLLTRLGTRLGLAEAGVFVVGFSLATDGWNHWATGQLSGFLGVTPIEGVIHRVFLLGVASLLLVFLVQKGMMVGSLGGVLVSATFATLVLDAAYHVTTGSVLAFVGDDATEVLLHALTYYGVASLVIARLLLKR